MGFIAYPINVMLKNRDRERQRALVRDITAEKLDVIKTAITMGYREEDLSALDERLERLVGSEQIESLLGAVRRSRHPLININMPKEAQKHLRGVGSEISLNWSKESGLKIKQRKGSDLPDADLEEPAAPDQRSAEMQEQ